MSTPPLVPPSLAGPDPSSLDGRRRRLLDAVNELRPRLHRYCTRMCGSPLDGEDVVQEALAQAYESIGTLQDESRLEPWLFRIAHHKCLDFLRRERGWRAGAVSYDDTHDAALPEDGTELDDALGSAPVDDALAALVGELPPKERAAVLLKDVLEYRLTEVADVIESTVGGVKAALHRARAKLRTFERRPLPLAAPFDWKRRELFLAYADCFNRRDWEALRRLIQADARLEVVGADAGTMDGLGRTYTSNYVALAWEWRIAVARVDGMNEPVLVHERRVGDTWHAVSAIRLWWDKGAVVRVRDYVHVDYLLAHSRVQIIHAGTSAP
jgi:RNA polymerase sigma-70 factor (ECF subfamily)